MAPMKLYGMMLSPNVTRVATVLNELGLDFEFVSVDLRTGAHKQPDFLKLNPFRPDPGAAGRGRSCLRVARHQPVHRDQVRGGGAAADAVGQAGGVAGGGVAPLLPAGARPRLRAAHQAHAGRPHRRRRGEQERRRPRQAARRLRGPPRRREQVPRRRRLHARRRQPHVLPLHAHQEPQGGPGGLPPPRQGLVGRDLRPPRLGQDRRLHPPPARRLRSPVPVLLPCLAAARME
uniref:glutathione transferase n=1 Tax=Hordeum vulgare subsp. vulgare TaxID=112509 RepID=F2E3X9_HORVV|nr:predicted protein [Hordeum vulgare subsp. vulgare]